MEAFLVDLPGLTPATPRDGAADVTFMCEIRGEANPVALVENGTQNRHIRRVGTTAKVRVVGDESVTLVKLRRAVTLQQSCGASRKRTHMERQHHVLGHHFTGGI